VCLRASGGVDAGGGVNLDCHIGDEAGKTFVVDFHLVMAGEQVGLAEVALVIGAVRNSVPRSISRIKTEAAGTAAPELSVTVPSMLPETACGLSVLDENAKKKSRANPKFLME